MCWFNGKTHDIPFAYYLKYRPKNKKYKNFDKNIKMSIPTYSLFSDMPCTSYIFSIIVRLKIPCNYDYFQFNR